MKTKRVIRRRNQLDKEIAKLEKRLGQIDIHDKEFKVVTDALEVLYKLKQSKKGGLNQLDANKVLAAGVNITGILLILNYERLGIVTTKAMQLLMKGGGV